MPSSLIVDALRSLAQPQDPGDPAVATAPLDGPDAAGFVELVLKHRLHAGLAGACRRAGRPVDREVAENVDDDRVVRLRASGVLRDAAGALDERDVPWLVFKGPVIAPFLAQPEFRGFNDVDLLVDRTRFGDAIDALTSIGGEELNRNWDPYVAHEVGEVPIEVGTVPIDLHWHLVGLAHTRAGMNIDPGGMLARRRLVRIGTNDVPTFDPVDQLLHLATHSGLSGAQRLDQLRDIAAVATDEAIDWTVFVERARTARVSGLVGHTLDRASIAIGIPIETSTLRDLAGTGLARRRRLDGNGVTSLRRIGVQWRRDSPVAAGRAIARSVVEKLPVPSGRRGWDFADPDSVLFHERASGGAARRADYIRLVERSSP